MSEDSRVYYVGCEGVYCFDGKQSSLLSGRPFEGYQDQPDTAERVRLEVQTIPFALPARVQWLNTDASWAEVCALYAEAETVAFRNDDGTLSIETPEGRRNAKPGEWIAKP